MNATVNDIIATTELANEKAMIENAKNNSKEYAVIYDKYYEKIFRFIYQRMDDKKYAFDTTQQVFLKALDNLQKYEYRGLPFSSWLYRIASNEITNLFRQKKTVRTVNIDSVNVYNIIEEIQESKIEQYHDTIVSIISEHLEEDDLTLI